MKYLDGKSPEELRLMAKKRCLAILERMDKTEYQLREKLKKDGFSEEIIAEAVAYVKEFHYIDDKRYASNYLESYKCTKSLRMMKQNLEQRGISREIISECMKEVEDCEEAALKELMKKKAKGKDLTDIKEKQKIYRYFCQKGYRYNSVQQILNEYIDE